MEDQLNPKDIAAILDSIPNSTSGAISLSDLSRNIEGTEDWLDGCSTTLIAILKAFDAITVVYESGSNRPMVKASSRSAYYFIKSLSAYLHEGHTIISNWERPGINTGPYSAHEVLSGPQFLYFMEQRRTTDKKNAHPIRKTTVVKAIIKARIRGMSQPVYLVQFDPFSHQYQLIGGHKRPTDIDVETALRREIEEELSQNAIRFAPNYEVRHLAKISTKEVSLTYGVYTEYDLHYSQITFKEDQLVLEPNDRWVTLKELMAGKAKNNIGINESAITELNKSLPGGLDGLELSLGQIQQRTLTQIVKDHPWEAIGIVLSVFGIALSIIFYFFS